jgi:transcriptional regulator with XRE-family HTH domain
MTEDEVQRERRRRGYWLRLARIRANLNQNEVARQLGMSDRSGTTVLAWEQGRRDPKATVLRQLAAIYGVPASQFIDPPTTDEERLDAVARLAAAAEQRDWDEGRDRGREADDEPAGGPGRLSA